MNALGTSLSPFFDRAPGYKRTLCIKVLDRSI